MHDLAETRQRRILIADDNRAIHDDFHKILGADGSASRLARMEAALFGDEMPADRQLTYQIDDAYQGAEALEKVRRCRRGGLTYGAAFVDMRMPPGWDGAETITRIWEEDPDLPAVICTAFSDYSWSEIFRRLGGN